jgi:hypothetical protein
MAKVAQSYANHARYEPLFHFVLGGMLAINFAYAVRHAIAALSLDGWMQLLVATALMLMFWFVRAFPVTAQDRIIRLELRMRLRELAPDVMPRFDQLTPAQVTALRFAGDGELADLTRRVLDGKLTKASDIKQAVTDWQADHWRV